MKRTIKGNCSVIHVAVLLHGLRYSLNKQVRLLAKGNNNQFEILGSLK